MMSNMNQDDPNRLLQMLAAKTGRDPAAIQRQIQSGDTESLFAGMDPASRATAEKVLADPGFAQKLFQTPQVKEFLQRLMGGKQ